MTDEIWLKAYPKDIEWDQSFEVKPLWSILDDAVRRFPNNDIIDFLGKTYSYAEIGHQVDRAAAGFQRLGVGKGTKVGLFLPNCPQFIISYFGILKAGGTVVNYSPLYSEQELLHQIEDSHTDIMVTLNLKVLYPKMKAMLAQSRVKKLIIGNMPEVLAFPKNLLFPLFKRGDIAAVPNDKDHVAFAQLVNNDGAYTPAEIDPATDIAVLQYTGGTTGVSKGAMLTHANLYANTMQGRVWFEGVTEGEETMMGVLPFFHVFAMTVVMNLSISIAAKIIMHPRFELEPVLKDLDKKKPTLFPGVPTMYTAINNYPKLSDYDLSSLKFCLSGGAPLPVEVKQNFESFTGCKLVEGYGLTETSPIASASPLMGVSKEASIGLPLPGTHIVITDREDPHKIMAQGEDGEICVIGPQVMLGYWGREEATAETIVDGMLHTGDVGYMDEEGYTFIIDRMKDLVLVGGFNVYPRHVEEAIYQHPGVEEVTVIGITDDYLGQVIKAFIKLKDQQTLTEDELIAFLGDKLAKHALPRQTEFRDELPKTMIGKLSKKELVAEEKEKYEAAKAAST
ncbi:MAG: long-chain fatty acid--CoA ligase [Alphaproteobacteria bacterium]|jgi:long-chain acyl-CoA synthetase|nr:long-chain fatty acid--CoA ligase [Alphaproteobacteria bacterium]MBT4018484.1 long-chain fatty acid--CoA ligase [Alphaproteobacteria bacterium]MBT5161308.1 long-chain fatty acid--CoA ligase [Alphaproteobacteria bacterium]MBT6386065.1 long-chain fatty acid--CoA ligase [Alphaproteobacteria bacterium]